MNEFPSVNGSYTLMIWSIFVFLLALLGIALVVYLIYTLRNINIYIKRKN